MVEGFGGVVGAVEASELAEESAFFEAQGDQVTGFQLLVLPDWQPPNPLTAIAANVTRAADVMRMADRS